MTRPDTWLRSAPQRPDPRPLPKFGVGAVPLAEISAALGGRAASPTAPVEIVGPQGQVLTYVCGFGETEGAEIEEIAEEALEVQAAQADWKIAELRHRYGLPEHDQVDGLVRQALRDHAEERRRDPLKFVRPAPDRSWVKQLPAFQLSNEEWDQAYELARWLTRYW